MRTRALLLWAVLLGFLPACFGTGSVPVMRYFWLSTWHDLKPGAREPLAVTVQVEEFDVEPAYDHLRVVYRVSPVQLRHYKYRQWVTKPGRMVRDSVKRYLQVGEVFKVVTESPRPIPQYVLKGRVVALEEVDPRRKGESWRAHLALVVRVFRASDLTMVYKATVDEEARIRQRTPEAVVDTLTGILRRFLDRETPRMVTALRKDMSR